jgi:hypothetical protein
MGEIIVTLESAGELYTRLTTVSHSLSFSFGAASAALILYFLYLSIIFGVRTDSQLEKWAGGPAAILCLLAIVKIGSRVGFQPLLGRQRFGISKSWYVEQLWWSRQQGCFRSFALLITSPQGLKPKARWGILSTAVPC